MNTNLPSALAASESGESHDLLQPTPEMVRATLIYLALSSAAVLMAAACIADWRVYFI